MSNKLKSFNWITVSEEYWNYLEAIATWLVKEGVNLCKLFFMEFRINSISISISLKPKNTIYMEK